jgi:hypothetical protein
MLRGFIGPGSTFSKTPGGVKPFLNSKEIMANLAERESRLGRVNEYWVVDLTPAHIKVWSGG